MKRNSIVVALMLTLSIAFNHAQITSPDDSKHVGTAPVVSLTLTAEPLKIQFGKPIELKVLLKNLTAGKLWVGREPGDFNERDYDVFTVDEKGEEAPDTAYYRHIKGRRLPTDPRFLDGSRDIRLIEPGDMLTSKIRLDNVRTIDHVGTYRIWVERFDQTSQTRVRSNTVIVTVIP